MAENKQYINQNTNRITYSQILKMQPELVTDTISFTGKKRTSAQNAEPLRKLMAYRVPDMYSGRIVIERSKVEKLLSEHIFSKNLKYIVKALLPYEECLLDVEKEIFSMIKSYALIRPQAKLDAFIRFMAPEHNKKLLEIQRPIFEELRTMSKAMPLEEQKEFDKLMNMVEKKLKFEPIVLPFNASDFQYKLKRISEQIKVKNNYVEKNTILQMLKIAKNFPKEHEEPFVIENYKSKAKRNKKLQALRKYERQQITTLKRLEMLRLTTELKNNPELEQLFIMANSQINGIPRITAFNRKTFIYDLQKITNNLENQKLAHAMIQKALELPTSHNNLSAFIVKYANSSAEKIGYSILCGSIGNIEHLTPFVKGGKDCLENYGICSEYTNSERGMRSMEQQLKRHPEIYINCQKQIDRLIELFNGGIFRKVGLSKFYIINFAQQMQKLSPKDKPLVLNLTKLKK